MSDAGRVDRPVEHSLPALPVIYRDDDVIVVDKPTGLLTHGTSRTDQRPSVARLLADQIDDDDQLRPGIVHRLDRDTSGVMIVARTATARRFLQRQFRQRSVRKTYIALVSGRITEPKASIQLPLAPDRRHPLKRQVAAAGKAATTEIEVLERFDEATLIEARPLTGRTHQLRVHLAMIGHPIIGDPIYGAQTAPRLYLHAHTLELTLPDGTSRRFTSPLPALFRHYQSNSTRNTL